MAEADIIEALVELLKADAEVAAAAVGTRVFGQELPQDVVATMPVNALVIVPTGGVPLTEGSKAELSAQRIDLFGYGKTLASANRLRGIASGRFLRTAREVVTLPDGSGVLIHWINAAGGFFAARERDANWPQSFQSFQVFYSLKEIAA